MDDGAKMGEETISKYFKQFLKDMCILYGVLYLNRRLNRTETAIKQLY